MIPGVETIPLTTHVDERGFFREILKADQITKFGQWSMSWMVQDTIKAFHYHLIQYDYWVVISGVIKAVVCDLSKLQNDLDKLKINTVHYWELEVSETEEFIMGDNKAPFVLVIPPGVAHGLKVLQGPAVLMYITSEEYNPKDEGRIPYDALGYDWHKVDIR